MGWALQQLWRGRREVLFVSDVPGSARPRHAVRRPDRYGPGPNRNRAERCIEPCECRDRQRKLLQRGGWASCAGTTTFSNRRYDAGRQSRSGAELQLLEDAPGSGSDCGRTNALDQRTAIPDHRYLRTSVSECRVGPGSRCLRADVDAGPGKTGPRSSTAEPHRPLDEYRGAFKGGGDSGACTGRDGAVVACVARRGVEGAWGKGGIETVCRRVPDP